MGTDPAQVEVAVDISDAVGDGSGASTTGAPGLDPKPAMDGVATQEPAGGGSPKANQVQPADAAPPAPPKTQHTIVKGIITKENTFKVCPALLMTMRGTACSAANSSQQHGMAWHG